MRAGQTGDPGFGFRDGIDALQHLRDAIVSLRDRRSVGEFGLQHRVPHVVHGEQDVVLEVVHRDAPEVQNPQGHRIRVHATGLLKRAVQGLVFVDDPQHQGRVTLDDVPHSSAVGRRTVGIELYPEGGIRSSC